MNYQETIEYLFNQLPVYQHVGGSAYKEGLDNSLALDKYFNHPHQKYKTIHVGGTNGKGSTSHTLAAILGESGYKVGLYTSPHLVDFRERIRVNGEKISEQYVVDFVAENKDFFEPIFPSFFELTMTMAFKYFADQEVDVAIIEVGLGGRLDSTNIISPDLSVITNISLDHTQFLGNSLDKIASEKAGIIKYKTPVVIGEASGEVKAVFEAKAQTEQAPIIFADQQSLILSHKTENGHLYIETEKYPELKNQLGGIAQLKNTATILSAVSILKQLGYKIDKQAVYSGFANVCTLTGLMGRWQTIQQENPKIICDTGHNIGGIKYITEQLKSETYNQLHIVIGMANDKDISAVLNILPKDATYYFTRAKISRAMDEKELAKQAQSVGLRGKDYPNIDVAIEKAILSAANDDLIFIGGSNFVIAEALEFFKID